MIAIAFCATLACAPSAIFLGGGSGLQMRFACCILAIVAAMMLLDACASLPAETAAEEGSWLALDAVDGAQTADIQNHPHDYEAESEMFIGQRPSTRSVATYFAAMAGLHIGATEFMTAHHFPRWAIRGFEAVTIADSARCVAGNEAIGLQVRFR